MGPVHFFGADKLRLLYVPLLVTLYVVYASLFAVATSPPAPDWPLPAYVVREEDDPSRAFPICFTTRTGSRSWPICAAVSTKGVRK